MNERKTNFLTPIIVACSLVVGMYVGVYYSSKVSNQQFSFGLSKSTSNGSKLNQILNYIENEYVDTIQREKLVENAITKLLAELDPHSFYIPAADFAEVSEPLEGNFEGIGVEFLMQNDTVTVVNTVVGGPSEAVGIMAGDRIVMVNEKLIAGKNLENDSIIKQLRGPNGSKVKVKIKRKNEKNLLAFTITRGKIPLNSVETALLLNDSTAFIKISRFAKNTYQEFNEAVAKLSAQPKPFKKLILDLRGNGGGYLTTAIEITEEFLPKGKLIVYTKGKSQAQRNYYSSKDGRLKNIDLKVLINESSASASEILAGALQDNDRGTIIGRRSFGKGLVQEQMDLPDHSALRLTVARYYTPTGRSIQKPYGEGVDYENDFLERSQHGELFSQDSIKYIDSLKFKTPKGRIVYGGGGITPDIFVPIDSGSFSMLVSSLLYSGTLNQFAFDYTDGHRTELKKYKNPLSFNAQFTVSEAMIRAIITEGNEEGIAYTRAIKPSDSQEIKLRIKALIARNVWGNDGFYSIMLPKDKTVEVAVKEK